MDKIIDNLTRINQNLEEIRQNQYALFYAINDGNRMTQQLMGFTERMAIAGERAAENSAIAVCKSMRSPEKSSASAAVSSMLSSVGIAVPIRLEA